MQHAAWTRLAGVNKSNEVDPNNTPNNFNASLLVNELLDQSCFDILKPLGHIMSKTPKNKKAIPMITNPIGIADVLGRNIMLLIKVADAKVSEPVRRAVIFVMFSPCFLPKQLHGA